MDWSKLRKQAIDQSAHGAVVLTAGIFAVSVGGVLGGALFGFTIGALAEIKEESAQVTLNSVFNALLSSYIDLTGYILSGAIVGAILF